MKGNVLTHVCLFLDETPGYGKIFFLKICGLSVCVAVHVPGVPQPVLTALTGVCVCVCARGARARACARVCVVCVCSCICTRCSAVWPTCTHRCVWSVCV